MRRFVAVPSSDVHDYCGFLIYVAILWRERIGYEPIIFLVGSYESWKAGRHGTLVPDILKQNGFRIEWVAPVEGVGDGTVAQSIRLHAAVLPDLNPDDLIIPSDADLLPLKRPLYYAHDLNKWPLGSIYSNGYGNENEGKHFPCCHLSATVACWSELMDLEGTDPRECLLRSFDKGDVASTEDMGRWFFDEHYLSKRILASSFWPDGVQMIRRQGQPPKDRLDRGCWPATYNPLAYTDCHSIRPFWSDKNYERLLPLFKATIDWGRWGNVLTSFREEFKAKMEATS